MATKLDPKKLGFAGAIVAAICMLVLSLFGKGGMYMGAVNMMQQWHMYYSLSLTGIITGIIEATVISFVFLYLFAWVYNKL